jgi:hypothetical protein
MKKIILLLFLLGAISFVKGINLHSTKLKETKKPKKTTTFANPTFDVIITRSGVSKSTKIIYVSSSGTESLDQGYDAGAFKSMEDPTLAIYSLLVNNSLGIDFALQVLSSNYNDKSTIPLSMLLSANSEITFSADINIEFPANRNVYLEDRVANIVTKISDTETYTVTVTEELNGPGRFYIHTSEFVWLGTTSTDWDIATNWSTGTVPTALDNVLITNVINKPIANADVTINDMAISAGASLTVKGNLIIDGKVTINSDLDLFGSLIVEGSSSGAITYDRFLNVNLVNLVEVSPIWYLIGSPVVGQTIENMIGSGDLATGSDGLRKGLATYNNNLNITPFGSWAYQTAASTGAMNSGQGFSIKRNYTYPFKSRGKMSFTGTLKTDDLLPYSITDGSQNQWNLLSNPYTSSIKANVTSDSFLVENINELDPSAAGIYVWDQNVGEYQVINNMTLVTNIAPGQGFFLASKTGGGTINIFKTMQTHQGGEMFLRSNTLTPHIKLNVFDEDKIKSTDIKYSQNTSKGLDIGYDAKMFEDKKNNGLAIYTHLVSDNKGVNFMLQALPDNVYEDIVVPIGLNALANKQVTFSCKALNLPLDIMIFLEDRVTNSFIRLDENNSEYSITPLDDIEGVGRFYLHTSRNALTTAPNLDLDLESISIYKLNKSTIRIEGLYNNKTTFTLFNILGKQIKQTSFIANGVKDIPLNIISGGVYIVEIQIEGRKIQKKIVLH